MQNETQLRSVHLYEYPPHQRQLAGTVLGNRGKICKYLEAATSSGLLPLGFFLFAAAGAATNCALVVLIV